jgi:hypothetical protein
MFKYINVLYYFMKESPNFCIPRTHPTEIHYNSSFMYANLIYDGISRNLTPEQTKGLLYSYFGSSSCAT